MSRLDEWYGIDLDGSDVEPPTAEILEGGDEPRVDERGQGEHERVGREIRARITLTWRQVYVGSTPVSSSVSIRW